MKEVLTERLVFKPRPEGARLRPYEEPGEECFKERQRARRGESLLFSRNSQTCMGEQSLESKAELVEIRRAGKVRPDSTSFYKQR